MTYTLVRSSRKTIAIYIRPGGNVEVRAPLRASRRDIDRFVASKQAWINEKIALVQARPEAPVYDPALEKQYRARAKEILPGKVAYYANLMGLSPAQVKVNGAQKRWGSCSGKGNLNFSWRLMLADDDVIDYVVVHELAHLREMNHSPRFWAVVAAVVPDYHEKQANLRALQRGIAEENR